MKRVRIEMEIELKKGYVGFVVVPTSDERLLRGELSVTMGKGESLATPCDWNCTNGVRLLPQRELWEGAFSTMFKTPPSASLDSTERKPSQPS